MIVLFCFFNQLESTEMQMYISKDIIMYLWNGAQECSLLEALHVIDIWDISEKYLIERSHTYNSSFYISVNRMPLYVFKMKALA